MCDMRIENMKIDSIKISNFRGIPNSLNLPLCKNKKSCSALIYGDNGTGKSTFIDAIELMTQGTIHGKRTVAPSEWIYNSKSKVNFSNITKININFDTNLSVQKEYAFNQKKLKINTTFYDKENDNEVVFDKNHLISAFCYAPFIFRRDDIMQFWSLKPVERMRIFLPFADDKKNEKGYIPITEREKIERIEKRRMSLKNEKRELLEKVCKRYNFSFDRENSKNQQQIFSDIKKKENIKALRDLRKRNELNKYTELRQLYNLLSNIKSCTKDIRRIKNKYQKLQDSKNGKYPQLRKVLYRISPEITKAFKAISTTSDYVDKIWINIATDTDMSMTFKVRLTNDEIAKPEKIFSEANRDLLALLVYFEFLFAKQKEGQSPVLVLDDTFQSIDATVRQKVMQYLLKRFEGWQFIITTHDRLWKERLINLFRNNNVPLLKYEIKNWTFNSGPKISIGLNNYDEKLKKTIEDGDMTEICSDTGYLLEYLCDKLSMIIGSGLERKKDDRYTIGDLWPGILKKMKKTKAKEIFLNLNNEIELRNIAGAHFNEWALSLSREEAVEFAKDVLKAYYCVYYVDKAEWIKSTDEVTGEELS